MNTNGNDGALEFDVLMDLGALDRGIDETNRRIKGLSNTTVAEEKKMDGVFNKLGDMAKGLIGPAAGMAAVFKFKQLAQEALEFEKVYGMAMREVQTISKAVQDDFEGMSEVIVNMSANGPDDAVKLAKAFYQIVSAGYDGAEGLKLLEIASRAAVAGVTDTTTAADGLTTVLNAWGLSVDKAGNVADVMFKTVERGKTTFSQLASSIAQVAPLAAANNIEFEQIFAALQTITKQGTPTAQAMTQIRSSIVNMNNVLGDGWAKTMTYQEGLNVIAKRAGGSQTALKALIPDVEGLSAVLALTGEKAKGAAEDLTETTKAAGSMETAYGRMMEEANNKWSVVMNKYTREVRALGQAMKEESVNVANFMDALLSNGADVDPSFIVRGISDRIKGLQMQSGGGFFNGIKNYLLAPFVPDAAVQQGYDKFVNQIVQQAKKGLSEQKIQLSDILGIEGKDERLTKLNSFLISLKAAQDDLGNTELMNSEQQNASLKIRGELWGEVAAQAKEAIKATEAAEGGGGETKARTLKVMLEEIKAQQDALGTGSMKEDITTLTRISALQQEVLAYYDNIRQARKVEAGTALKSLSGKDSLGGVQTITKEQIKQQLQGDKLLKLSKAKTAEAQKQADAIKEQNDQYTKQTAFFEGLTEKLSDAGQLLGAMSYAVGEFDSTLGESVGKMADLANNAADMVANYASGNMVGAIASGIGIVGNIIGMTQSNKEDPTAKALEKVNDLLERQSVILANLSGENYFTLAEKQIKTYTDALNKTNTALKASAVLTKDEYARAKKVYDESSKSQLWMTQMGNPTFSQFLNSMTSSATAAYSAEKMLYEFSQGNLANLNEQQMAWITEISQNVKARAELMQETFRSVLGFDASTVSDSIFQGIEEGLELSENGLGTWTQSFGELMKTALMQSVIDGMDIKLTSGFLAQYKAFMEDGELSASDRAELETLFAEAVKQGETDTANIKSITDPYLGGTSSEQAGATGISAGASEETVSAMVGQAMAMRVDMKDMSVSLISLQDIGLQQVEILDASLYQLTRIGKNTDNLEKLNTIEAGITETNRILKDKL